MLVSTQGSLGPVLGGAPSVEAFTDLNARGAAVFVTINPTDLNERKLKNVIEPIVKMRP